MEHQESIQKILSANNNEKEKRNLRNEIQRICEKELCDETEEWYKSNADGESYNRSFKRPRNSSPTRIPYDKTLG